GVCSCAVAPPRPPPRYPRRLRRRAVSSHPSRRPPRQGASVCNRERSPDNAGATNEVASSEDLFGVRRFSAAFVWCLLSFHLASRALHGHCSRKTKPKRRKSAALQSAPLAEREATSPLADAVQILVVAQEQLPIADGETRVRAALVVGEYVVGQQFELRLRRHDIGPFELRDEVELAVREDRRRPHAADVGPEALFFALAGGRILHVQSAARFAGPVQIAVVIDGRRGI